MIGHWSVYDQRGQQGDQYMMIMAVKEDSGKVAGPQECAGCGKKIHDKFLLKVSSVLIINVANGWDTLQHMAIESIDKAPCLQYQSSYFDL